MARRPADQTVQRRDILVAAAAVFQERGYEGATMADIARRVNLTAGSLYHHFPAGKRDLLLAVLNAGLDVILQKVDDILAAKLSPGETLRQIIEAHVVGVTENLDPPATCRSMKRPEYPVTAFTRTATPVELVPAAVRSTDSTPVPRLAAAKGWRFLSAQRR